MKIEEAFPNLKSLLGIGKLMNKQPTYMEKMLALVVLVFAVGLLMGEHLQAHWYGEPVQDDEVVPEKERIPGLFRLKKSKKWKRYSGLFTLLKQKWSLSGEQISAVLEAALGTFMALVQPHVRTFIRTSGFSSQILLRVASPCLSTGDGF